MKEMTMKMMFAAAFGLLACAQAQASPYFRLFDPGHIGKSAGAWIDPLDTGNTSAGTSVALVTHSTKDGCFLPSVVCEDWTPLGVGLSANAGHLTFDMGPSANLLPMFRRGLLGAVSAMTREWEAVDLKQALAEEGPDGSLSLAFGPALALSPIRSGVVQPFSQWNPGFRLFAGAAWKF